MEDFTEFEQRAAYFDGDPVIATKKGVNILERGSQVHFMAEFHGYPRLPAGPEAGPVRQARPEEGHRRGTGAGRRCSSSRAAAPNATPPPYYTDNTHAQPAHRAVLQAARSYNGCMAIGDGPIKTFPLRGIKDSPPYLHDGRLLTLEDTVEFHNLVLETKLTEQEKKDLVDFLRCL